MTFIEAIESKKIKEIEQKYTNIIKRIISIGNRCRLCDQWDGSSTPNCCAWVDLEYNNDICTSCIINTLSNDINYKNNKDSQEKWFV